METFYFGHPLIEVINSYKSNTSFFKKIIFLITSQL